MRRRRTLAAGALALTALLTTSACANVGLEPAPEAPPGFIDELRMPSEAGGSVQGLLNYNWLSPNATVQTWLFEPLMIRDRFTCEAVPWLATEYEWENTNKFIVEKVYIYQYYDGKHQLNGKVVK